MLALIQQHDKTLAVPRRTGRVPDNLRSRERAIRRLIKITVPKLSANTTSSVDFEN